MKAQISVFVTRLVDKSTGRIMTNTQLQTIPTLTPGGDINAYIASVGRFDILSVEREQQLARQLVNDGDLNAARELVLAHLRFVVHIAKSYNGYGLGLGDLIQEGNVGLMKAVKRFDPDKGVRLVSFAVPVSYTHLTLPTSPKV